MLKQKFVLSYVSQLIIQFLNIAASIVIARVAGPSVMGKLTFGLSYVGMFGFISQMGLGAAHIKLVSEGNPLDKCLGTYIRLITVTTSLFVLVTLSFFFIQKYGFKVNFEGFDAEFCIYASIIVAVITSINGIVQTTFSAKIKQAKQDVPNILVNFISAIAKIILVLLGFRVIMLASWSIVHAIMLLGISAYLFRNQVIGNFDRDLAKKYIMIASPLLLVVVANALIFNLDKVLLKFFVSTTEVGYYGASYRIGGFIQLIASNIGAMFFPLFSAYLAKGQVEELKNKINQYQRASVIYILPFVLFVVIFSPTIVRVLLGKQYAPSIVPMAIITVALYIYTLFIPYGNILVASGKYLKYAVNQFIALGFYVGFLFLFTYPQLLNLKSTGTAIALLLMHCISCVIYVHSSRRLIPMEFDFNIVKIALVMVGVFAGFYMIYRILPHRIINEVVLAVGYFSIMFLSLWLTRLLNPKDWMFFRQALNPSQMKSYIKTEFSESD